MGPEEVESNQSWDISIGGTKGIDAGCVFKGGVIWGFPSMGVPLNHPF